MNRRTGIVGSCNQLRALHALLVPMIGLILSACGRQTATATELATRAVGDARQAVQSHAEASHQFAAIDSGEYSGESFVSTWRAGTSSGGLRYISELITEAYAVQRDRLFEFDSTGALVHYLEHTNSTLQREIERGSAYIGTIELEFAGGEAVFRARKTGGASRSIRQWEVDRVLERAELLRRKASRDRVRSATSPANAMRTQPARQ